MKTKAKQWACILLCMTLIFATLTVHATAANISSNFTDISSHWAKEHIVYVCDTKEVMSGTSSTKFSPNENIKRCDMVVILANMRKVQTDNSALTGFSDVPSGRYYTGAVEWAKRNGIISGTENSKFQPENPISRQDMCVMLYNFGNFCSQYTFPQKYPSRSYLNFSDSSKVSQYARNAITTLIQADIISGSGGAFRPTDNITRAEVAAIVSSFYQKANGDNVTANTKVKSVDEQRQLVFLSGDQLFAIVTIKAVYRENYHLSGSNAVYNHRSVWIEMKENNPGFTNVNFASTLPSHVSDWKKPSGGSIFDSGFTYCLERISSQTKTYARRNSQSSSLQLRVTSSDRLFNPVVITSKIDFDVPAYYN